MTQFIDSLSLSQALGLSFFGSLALFGVLTYIATEVDELLTELRVQRYNETADEFQDKEDPYSLLNTSFAS